MWGSWYICLSLHPVWLAPPPEISYSALLVLTPKPHRTSLWTGPAELTTATTVLRPRLSWGRSFNSQRLVTRNLNLVVFMAQSFPGFGRVRQPQHRTHQKHPRLLEKHSVLCPGSLSSLCLAGRAAAPGVHPGNSTGPCIFVARYFIRGQEFLFFHTTFFRDTKPLCIIQRDSVLKSRKLHISVFPKQ